MCLVRVPSSLRDHCGGSTTVHVEAASLGQALSSFERAYPGCACRICRPDGHTREFVRVYVNDESRCVCDQPDLALSSEDVVTIVPAVAGG